MYSTCRPPCGPRALAHAQIGVRPCRSAAATLALTRASSSLWFSRRSEWPTTTYEQPSLDSIPARRRRCRRPRRAARVLRAVADPEPVTVHQRLHRAITGERRQDRHVHRLVVRFVGEVERELLHELLASRWLRFIFQLPAISGRRDSGCSAGSLLQDGQAGQGLALQVLQPAPPPVEMWAKPSSAQASSRTAAAESPPPTTLSRPRPVTSTIACVDAAGPAANGAARTRPWARSRRWSARRRRRSANAFYRLEGRCRGPASRPGSRRPAPCGCSPPRRKSLRDHDVGGQDDLAPDYLEQLAGSSRSGPPPAASHPTHEPLGGEEGEAHPAADQQRARPCGSSDSITSQLVGHLCRPAQHVHVGPLRLPGQLARARPARSAPAPRVVRQLGRRRRRPTPACGAPPRTRPRRTRPRPRAASTRRTRRARPRPCWSRAESKRMFFSSSSPPGAARSTAVCACSPTRRQRG